MRQATQFVYHERQGIRETFCQDDIHAFAFWKRLIILTTWHIKTSQPTTIRSALILLTGKSISRNSTVRLTKSPEVK